MTEHNDVDIAKIALDGEAAIAGATSTDALAQVDTELLGKRSVLAAAHRSSVGSTPRLAVKSVGSSMKSALRSSCSWRLGGPSWPEQSVTAPWWPTASI